MLWWLPSHGRHGFAAALTPHGIDVVEHASRAGKLSVERHARSGEALTGIPEAAERLADLVESLGGRGRRLNLVLSGFESRYHVLELPAAERKLLAPVVERELKRLEPNIVQPVVGFSFESPSWKQPKTVPPGVLAAVIPQGTLEILASTLERRGIGLQHVTVIPQAMQRLYEVFCPAEDPAVLLLVTPELTVIAAFVEGRVRLCWESNVRTAPGAAIDQDVLAGRLAAARHFVQQISRGRVPAKVFLSAEPEERGLLEDLTRRTVPVTCEPLGPAQAAPGALLALGASLDAAAADRLDLLPSFLKPSVSSEPRLRVMVAGACALAVGVAGWSAWAGLSRAAGSSPDADDLTAAAALEARLEALEPILLERRAHAARVALLRELWDRRALPPALLEAIALATPPQVQLDTIAIERLERGWQARVSGRGSGTHAAAAMGAVDQMFRELSRRLPEATAVLTHLSDAGGDRPGETSVRFAIALDLNANAPGRQEGRAVSGGGNRR
ncbi:MAG: hypothetical protein KatS3mg081_0982 [Gemmatimonadales bacterium]|nr:MAG: hypothetical protein KatS3mg081_0982 [Gemmatimonadales bacterium]